MLFTQSDLVGAYVHFTLAFTSAVIYQLSYRRTHTKFNRNILYLKVEMEDFNPDDESLKKPKKNKEEEEEDVKVGPSQHALIGGVQCS